MAFEKSQNLQAPIRKLGTSKKLTHFPWIPRPLEPFLVDLRLKVFPMENSTIIWRDCSEIILEIGLPYQKLLGNFQIQSQNFM